MDQWEGQSFRDSRGNLVSEAKPLYVAANSSPISADLQLTRVLPTIEMPADANWVKRIKIQSKPSTGSIAALGVSFATFLASLLPIDQVWVYHTFSIFGQTLNWQFGTQQIVAVAAMLFFSAR